MSLKVFNIFPSFFLHKFNIKLRIIKQVKLFNKSTNFGDKALDFAIFKFRLGMGLKISKTLFAVKPFLWSTMVKNCCYNDIIHHTQASRKDVIHEIFFDDT
ncbi:uncharacterized protein LOC110696628 [Chenopodium quinoa]|uniref:uncharacterized protein LOC110696628 n=1 Tax=Chenopodium quinoa TaxID=63459 RepID=UPI000B783E07|nr:uncharacterized protein LOC110696628 [Chenopodium quinoa]